jgi:hypothetical protein
VEIEAVLGPSYLLVVAAGITPIESEKDCEPMERVGWSVDLCKI